MVTADSVVYMRSSLMLSVISNERGDFPYTLFSTGRLQSVMIATHRERQWTTLTRNGTIMMASSLLGLFV